MKAAGCLDYSSDFWFNKRRNKAVTKYSTLIVGAHFRPPAKQVLAHCVSGTKLSLQEDNENAYDSAAVRVILDPAVIPATEYPTLESELLEAGITLEQLLSGGPIQLGFVPAQDGKPLAKARATNPTLLGNQQVREIMLASKQAVNLGEDADHAGIPYSCQLDFAADGSPKITITVEA